MEPRKIKVAFTDFWDGFDPADNFFTRILARLGEVVLSDEPDYLFFSVFGNDHLDYDCIKIFYTGENQAPDFNLCDYALGFERMEFGDRYLRLPNWLLYTADVGRMEGKHQVPDAEWLAGRDGFCAFVCSNNNSSPERNQFFDRLSTYKRVASGGRFRNNVGGPVADKLEFLKGFRFSIAFENCSHPGYTTEKIIQAFGAGNIPIYWGDPQVAETFNPESFVNCHDYGSWDEVVEAVRALDADPERQLAMLHAPALADPGMPQRLMRQLTDFLEAILSQDPARARRFSRDYWGARYRKQARMREKAYRHSLRGIAEAIYKKTLWKSRRDSSVLWKLDRLFKRK